MIPYARYGAALTTVVQGAEALTVTGCGHVPMYDDPEQVSAVIVATTMRVDGKVSAVGGVAA